MIAPCLPSLCTDQERKCRAKTSLILLSLEYFQKTGAVVFFSFCSREIKCDTDEFQKTIKGGKRVKVIISYYQKTWLKRVKGHIFMGS